MVCWRRRGAAPASRARLQRRSSSRCCLPEPHRALDECCRHTASHPEHALNPAANNKHSRTAVPRGECGGCPPEKHARLRRVAASPRCKASTVRHCRSKFRAAEQAARRLTHRESAPDSQFGWLASMSAEDFAAMLDKAGLLGVVTKYQDHCLVRSASAAVAGERAADRSARKPAAHHKGRWGASPPVGPIAPDPSLRNFPARAQELASALASVRSSAPWQALTAKLAATRLRSSSRQALDAPCTKVSAVGMQWGG